MGGDSQLLLARREVGAQTQLCWLCNCLKVSRKIGVMGTNRFVCVQVLGLGEELLAIGREEQAAGHQEGDRSSDLVVALVQ